MKAGNATPRSASQPSDKHEAWVSDVSAPVTFLLPGGYHDPDGTLHREVELAPLSGCEEELLADCAPAARTVFLTVLLTRCVRRIGTVSPVPSDMVRGLLIADRSYLVLKLREVTFGAQVQATVQCPWEDCGKKVDID